MSEAALMPEWLLKKFPRPCHPRKAHRCLLCSAVIRAKEPCVRYSALVGDGEGWRTWHAHPECYSLTEDWDDYDWESHFPCPSHRPAVRLIWPEGGAA